MANNTERKTSTAEKRTDLAGRISARISSPRFRLSRLGGGSPLSELPTTDDTDYGGRKTEPRCFRFTPERDRQVQRAMDALGISNRTVAIEIAIDLLANKLGLAE